MLTLRYGRGKIKIAPVVYTYDSLPLANYILEDDVMVHDRMIDTVAHLGPL